MKAGLLKIESIEKFVRIIFRNDYLVHKNKYPIGDPELAKLNAHVTAIGLWNDRRESEISRDQAAGVTRDLYKKWCRNELTYLLTIE